MDAVIINNDVINCVFKLEKLFIFFYREKNSGVFTDYFANKM